MQFSLAVQGLPFNKMLVSGPCHERYNNALYLYRITQFTKLAPENVFTGSNYAQNRKNIHAVSLRDKYTLLTMF